MEALISVFIFSVVITAVMASLVNVYGNRKDMKLMQQNLEDARFGLELMAKSLRYSELRICCTSEDSFNYDGVTYQYGACKGVDSGHGSTCEDGIFSGTHPAVTVVAFDYARSKCVKYTACQENKFRIGEADPDANGKCPTDQDEYNPVYAMNGHIENNAGKFKITEAGSGESPRLTIGFDFCSDESCKFKIPVQSTVTLRSNKEVTP